MQYQEFLDKVNEQIKDVVPADAERVTGATLQTLRERITGGEAADLASQLPAGIKEYLSDGGSEEAESFSLPQFYMRVARKEDNTTSGVAAYHANAVMGVLRQATSGGELEDIKEQLPQEYGPLFHGGKESE